MTTPKAPVTREHRKAAFEAVANHSYHPDSAIAEWVATGKKEYFVDEPCGRVAQALADTEQQALASRSASEQVPTGEVALDQSEAARRFLHQTFTWDPGYSASNQRLLETLLTTREAAAYSRGKAEAERGESDVAWKRLFDQQLQQLRDEGASASKRERAHGGNDYVDGKLFAYEYVLALFSKLAPPLPQPEAQRDATEGAAWETLSMSWSRREKDLLINYPSKPDGHLLHVRLNASRFDGHEELPSFVSELEARGYDITTLRFSVKRLPESAAKAGKGPGE